jgi:hypothetical protein
VAAHSEQIPDGIMERESPLGVTSGFESAHLPFPLASRLMRDSLHTVSHAAEDASYGSRVASELVGNDSQWFGALAVQQSSKESLCGTLITTRLDQDVDHVAILSTARHKYCC